MTLLTQCKMTKGDKYKIAWVKEKLAKVGKMVDGWLIQETYQTLSEKTLGYVRKGIREHRKRTGDAMLKKWFEDRLW